MFWKISIQVKNDDVYILAAGCKISICLRNMFWWLCSKKQKPDQTKKIYDPLEIPSDGDGSRLVIKKVR